jgi:hypothetical protein
MLRWRDSISTRRYDRLGSRALSILGRVCASLELDPCAPAPVVGVPFSRRCGRGRRLAPGLPVRGREASTTFLQKSRHARIGATAQRRLPASPHPVNRAARFRRSQKSPGPGELPGSGLLRPCPRYGAGPLVADDVDRVAAPARAGNGMDNPHRQP